MPATGYDYIGRVMAPNVCEFYVQTPQGHRIVRISLDSQNPRVTAYNETNCSRSPATLYLQEIRDLIKRAKQMLYDPNSVPS